MNLYWFLLVVSALAVGSSPAEATELGRCLGASCTLVLGWVVLTQVAASTSRRAVLAGVDPLHAALMLERQLDILRWLGLVVAGVCLLGFKLASAVQTWPLFESSMTLQSIVLLAPAVLITISVWLSEHRYGVALGYTESTGLGVFKELIGSLVATGGWILAPVLALLLVTDLVRWSGWFDAQSSAALMSIIAIIGVPFLVPLIIRRVWKTSPIADSDRDWVESLMVNSGMKRLPVRVWDTSMRSYNAVVAGFLPGLRSLIVTDRLLAEMPRREMVMVLLHEISHVRRGHVWLRVLAMIPSWVAAAALSSLLPQSPVVSVVSNLIAVAITLLTLRWVAHATEHDADRLACQLSLSLPAILEPPLSEQDAADRYCRALRWVTRHERSPDKSSWLHPSVDARCAKLQRWAGIVESTALHSPSFQHPVHDLC